MVDPQIKKNAILTRVTIATLFVLCQRMRVKYRGTQKLGIAGDLASLGCGVADCI